MASSLNLHSPQSLSLSSKLPLSPQTLHSSSLPFPFSPPSKKALSWIASAAQSLAGAIAPAIAITENAKRRLRAMRLEKNEDLYVRVGAKRGGCSGPSYTVAFEGKESSRGDDCMVKYDGFVILCDPESLAVIRDAQLEFNETPFGGGFTFKDPNPVRNCSCSRAFCCRAVNNENQGRI